MAVGTCLSNMATGEDALAGRPENIPLNRFPPDDKIRTIHFKGIYLLIVNEGTGDQKAYEDNSEATTEFEKYDIPAGYTCYIRGATVFFDV